MRTLLLTALLLATPGAARAEGGAPPSKAAKPSGAARAARPKGAAAEPLPVPPGEKKRGEKKDPQPKPGEQGGEKPCEPVKPCPID